MTTSTNPTGLAAVPQPISSQLPGLGPGTDVSYQIGYAAEDPRVAAYRMGLIEEARQLYNMPLDLPAYEVEGPSRGQIEAADLARQGIGAYEPYLEAGSRSLTQGQALAQQGANLAAGINVAPEFQSAQTTLGRGLSAADLMGGYATAAGAGLFDIRSGIGGIQYARTALPSYLQANTSLSNPLLQEAAGTIRKAAPFDLTYERGVIGEGRGLAGQASREAQEAARLGTAPTATAAELASVQGVGIERVSPTGITGAQTGFRPDLQTFQMGPAERAAAQQVGVGDLRAAQTGFRPNLQTFQMGPAQQVTTQSFADPRSVEGLMSPYMQNVVAIQQREAQRQADIAKQGRAAQAVRSGAFGGTREGVVEAEAQRNLAQQLGDIQATGLQQAYQQAQQQFNAEQQARLAAQQANQQAGLTVGQQNLAAQLGIQQLGTQTGLQTALANLSNEQQARVQQEANRLQAGGMNQQAALQTALANQQAGLTVGQQNLAAQLGVQQLGTQTGLQTALANLSNEQQARIQTEANRLQAGGMNQQTALQASLANQGVDLTRAQQNAQLLQQARLANQALQGQYGLQGAQLGLQAAAQRFQQAGFDATAAMQMAQLQQATQGMGLQQGAALQGLGGLYAQQAAQQAQLGQAGMQLYGSLAGQEAQLGGMLPAQIAQAQAGIDAQRSGLYGQLGQGLGSLAAQRAGIDLQRAGTLGQMGQGIGQLGVNQAALGQAATQLGQSEVSTLMGIGAMEQANEQAQTDAIRASQMQDVMAPFQQLAFVSDIYRGAPSTQSSLIGTSQPSASPFQTAAGLGIAALSAGAAAKKTGLI